MLRRVGELVMPQTDRWSGQPDLKATPVAIAPVAYKYRGFALTRTPIELPAESWWARVAMPNAHGLLLASNEGPNVWRVAARALLGGAAASAARPAGATMAAGAPIVPAQAPADDVGTGAPEPAEYLDAGRGSYRAAAFANGKLLGCLFLGPSERAPQWDAVIPLFAADPLADTARRVLLSRQATDGLAAAGPTICACFGVGLATIREALASGDAWSVETLGTLLRAGTNCGSCLPEIKRIVAEASRKATATAAH